MITLYKKAKTGKISVWSVWIEEDKGVPVIVRETGYSDGKKTIKKKFVRKGTNIGKKNEKTAYQQAEFLLENMVQAKVEENMVRRIDEVDMPPKFIYPALAKEYSDKKVKFPCFVQPKYDGVRCVQFNHINDNRLISRQRNEFVHLAHIRNAIKNLKLPSNLSLDGECYVHGFIFEDLISVVKKFYAKDQKDHVDLCTEDLCYYVYDLPIPDMKYLERKKLIDKYIPENHPVIKRVPTIQVNSWEEIKRLHDMWVKEGYEGIIIRDKDGYYAFNDRDYSIMKYKEFFDDEFEIVGHEAEEYTDTNNVFHKLIIWRCRTKKGEEFTARPRGSFERREFYYNNAEKYYGKFLTVRYQEKTSSGVPRFGVGIAIRDYE
jgi:DNA ligase-1